MALESILSEPLFSSGSWQIRNLDAAHKAEVFHFLERHELLNIYLLSRLSDEGFGSRGQTVAIRRRGETICIASLTINLAISIDPEIDASTRTTAMAILSELILGRALLVRAVIAPADAVEELWKRIGSHYEPPTVVRLNQPVYALEALSPTLTDLSFVRLSQSSDLDQLVPACAAMHREEVGIDPLTRDAIGYRRRIEELVGAHRSFIAVTGGEIVFKCEVSAETPRAAQLMGVWTHPAYRRQGWARRGMTEVCGHLLRNGKQVTLFVNDFNEPAIRLYRSLGFRQIGRNCALIW